MPARGRTLLALALLLGLGASACDSGGAEVDRPTTAASAPPPNPARRLGPVPSTCGAPRPARRLVSLGDYGNLIGSSPVWAGFYANFDPNRGGYHVQRDAPRTGYGWRIKVLWVVADDVKEPVRVIATSNAGSRLWFKVGDQGTRPRPQATLDPAKPGVPPSGDYLEFPSYVYIPRASCYRLDVTWPEGSWRLVVALGR